MTKAADCTVTVHRHDLIIRSVLSNLKEILRAASHITINGSVLALITADGFLKGSIDDFLNLEPFTFGNDTYLMEKFGRHYRTETFLRSILLSLSFNIISRMIGEDIAFTVFLW